MSEERNVARLIGVYHADGGVRGELVYVVGKLRGTEHCALCDITHGRVRRKASFDALCSGLPVPLELVHLNERSPDLLTFTGERTPTVVAELDHPGSADYVEVLDPATLETLGGDINAFGAVLEQALAAHHLRPAG